VANHLLRRLKSAAVRLRFRNKHRRVLLGRADDVDAELARSQARRLLAEVALDGLPKRIVIKASPTLTDFVASYWKDMARLWKSSTAFRNWNAWKAELEPVFGASRVGDITKADVTRWRDGCAGVREARYNRAVPVLSALFKYSEALHLRRRGSNPARGVPRYKREACERYLTPLEYRRVGAALREMEAADPLYVAIARLLLYTGARVSEIRGLRWAWIRPPHLALPDSKTGPKLIWLNSRSLAILSSLTRRNDIEFVFANPAGTAPIDFDKWWDGFRRRCALPDVRNHDLRRSFASTAIMDNVPLATIGKLLGHVLPETTAKYTHLADDVIADAAQRVSDNLAQAIGLQR
jgi:integrase